MHRAAILLLIALTLSGVLGRGTYQCTYRKDRKTNNVQCCSSQLLPYGCECFDISRLRSDYTNTAGKTPQCPDDVGTTFTLYNPTTDGALVTATETGVTQSPIDPALPIYMIVHGYTDSTRDPWLQQMKTELLKNAACNVILVDWEKGAAGPRYYQATANTRTVGAMVAKLVHDIHLFLHVSLDNFHLIGHSLGAHTMGYAGDEVFRLSGHRVKRVTGMDPAGPAFEDTKIAVHLDKTDAKFVDIIHTDAERFVNAGYGIQNSTGDVDFYPNGGVHQPGCPPENYGMLSMVNFEEEQNSASCSHARVVYLFVNSINICQYKAPDAPEACTMGFYTTLACTGDQYLNTTDTQPYC